MARLAVLIAEGKAAGPDRETFIHVNSLQGNALETIEAMLSDAS